MGFPKKCVEEFGTFVNLEFYSSTSSTRSTIVVASTLHYSYSYLVVTSLVINPDREKIQLPEETSHENHVVESRLCRS